MALQLGIAPSQSRVSDLKSSRTVEYSWLYMNMPDQFSCRRVLDIGSVGSSLPITLGQLGYEVWCIDVRRYEYAGLLPSVKSTVGDIRTTSFSSNSFDTVTAVSTIEHIGLGRYGESIDPDGDRKAVKEVKRILALNGYFLMTFPFGMAEICQGHRVYDEQTLMELLDGFRIEHADYYRVNADGFWCPCARDRLAHVRSAITERGLACIKARNT